MAKQSKNKPSSTERLTPAPPGRKRPKLGPGRSPQRYPPQDTCKQEEACCLSRGVEAAARKGSGR